MIRSFFFFIFALSMKMTGLLTNQKSPLFYLIFLPNHNRRCRLQGIQLRSTREHTGSLVRQHTCDIALPGGGVVEPSHTQVANTYIAFTHSSPLSIRQLRAGQEGKRIRISV